jgi:hypothetical protein
VIQNGVHRILGSPYINLSVIHLSAHLAAALRFRTLAPIRNNFLTVPVGSRFI